MSKERNKQSKMILPIVGYGNQVLRKRGEEIDADYPNLGKLIEDMFHTMEHASGVGLAAPQVNHSIRLFIIDSTHMFKDDEPQEGIKEVFINAEMIDETGVDWSYEEGCLSIPKVRAEVTRKDHIRIQYLDADFKEQVKEFSGKNARVIQHEYDHIEGKLFIDHLKPLKRTMIKGRLDDIIRGKVDVDYRMRFAKG